MIDETTYDRLQEEWRTFRNNVDPLIVTTEDGDILTWRYDDDSMSKTLITAETNNILLSHLIHSTSDTKFYLNVFAKELSKEYIKYIEDTIKEYKKNNLLKDHDDYTVNCICADESYGSYVTWLKDAEEDKLRELHDALELVEKSGYLVTKRVILKTDLLLWNKCDACGEFISIEDFDNGKATRRLVSCDSECSSEDYETLHKECEEADLGYANEE
jgi:hypothetical protein